MAGYQQVLYQLAGIGAIGLATLLFSIAVALPIKYTLGLRASESHETLGLDKGEHDTDAYLIPTYANGNGELATATA